MVVNVGKYFVVNSKTQTHKITVSYNICRAGNNKTFAEQYGATVATMKCTANPNDICGGPLINSLYEIVPLYTYVGSFNDGESNEPRALQKRFSGVRYTPSTCYVLAASYGFKVFGLQYGGECW